MLSLTARLCKLCYYVVFKTLALKTRHFYILINNSFSGLFSGLFLRQVRTRYVTFLQPTFNIMKHSGPKS